MKNVKCIARLNLTLLVVHNDLITAGDKIYQFVIFKDQKYLKENLMPGLT